MDFRDYTNLLKAVIHFNKNVPSFYADLMLDYDGCMGLLKICLYKDQYETTCDVKHSDNISIFRIKLFSVSPAPQMSMPKESRLMFSGFGDTISKRMNMYINSSSTDIIIGNGTVELSQVPIDVSEEEIFQLSTLASVPDYSDYEIMREHYHYFSEFCPQDIAISIAEKKEELNNMKLKDFCTQKVWGLLNLA